MSGLEYGGGGFIGNVFGNTPPPLPPPAQRILARTKGINRDHRVLQGLATRYNKPFIFNNEVKVFKPGAFSASLQSFRAVRFLNSHDESQCCGTTDDRLELLDCKEGIAFRFTFPDTPLGIEIKTRAEGRSLQGMSIGFDLKVSETKSVEGTEVEFIQSATLHEISICETGAVADAYASVVDGNVASLHDDYRLGKLMADGSFVSMHRALKALRATL